MKCDFCNKQATAYGSNCSYQACDDHTALGEEVESKMFDAMQEDTENNIYSPEFLRET